MHPKHLRHLTYAFAFFVTLHVALVTYTNSNALARVVVENRIPFVYTLGFILGLIALIVVPRLLRDIGDVRTTIVFIVLEMVALVGLALFPTSPLFILFFLLHLIIPPLLILDIDVFLEHATKTESTGGTRGLLLTILSSAFVISPLIAGFVVGPHDVYSRIYFLSALVLLPALGIILVSFKHFKDPSYRQIHLLQAIKGVIAHKNIRGIFVSNLLLRGFYAVMVIYMPLYLHHELLMPWTTIGVIFTVMLLPFVLFEYPLGLLADTRFGEKEILAGGFLICAIATALLPFIPATAFVMWGVALFMTRVGASAIESMNDTYFFKKVGPSDTETMALYRMLEPMSYIIAPLLTGLALQFIEVRFVFLILGVIMAFGIPVALRLKDTR